MLLVYSRLLLGLISWRVGYTLIENYLYKFKESCKFVV